MPKFSATSQCGFGSKAKVLGSLQRRTSTFSSSPAPTGTESSGKFGKVVVIPRSSSSIALISASNALILPPTSFISAILAVASSLFRFN